MGACLLARGILHLLIDGLLQAGQYCTFEFEGIGDSILTRSWTLSCHPDETIQTNTISITVKKVIFCDCTVCREIVLHSFDLMGAESYCHYSASQFLQVGKASSWLWDNMGQLRTIAFRGLDGIFTSDLIPTEGEGELSPSTFSSSCYYQILA